MTSGETRVLRICDAAASAAEPSRRGCSRWRSACGRLPIAATSPVVVPYGNAASLVRALEARGPSRHILRALQRFTVNVRKKDRDAWVAAKLVREVHETVFVIDPALSAAYDERF